MQSREVLRRGTGNRLVKKINRKVNSRKQFFEVLATVENILCWCYLIFTAVILQYYNKGTYGSIGSDKVAMLHKGVVFFGILSVGIGLAFFVAARMHTGKQYVAKEGKKAQKGQDRKVFCCEWKKIESIAGRTRWSWLDCFVLGYGMAALLSYLFSDYKEMALWGKPGWGMGMLVQVSFATSYFLFSRMWKESKWGIYVVLIASIPLFLLGYLNRFGYYPVLMEYRENTQYIGFAGNINWYCGYMVMPMCMLLYLVWQLETTKGKDLLLNAGLFVGFCALLTNGSTSGYFAIAVVFLILFWMSAPDWNRMKDWWKATIVFLGACIFTFFLRKIGLQINYAETAVELFTGSELPFLLLGVAGSIYAGLLLWTREKGYPEQGMRKAAKYSRYLVVGGIVLIAGMILINTVKPGSLGPLSKYSFFTFSEEWGSRRGATWKAGWMAWNEQGLWKKLIGVGPDCMSAYIYQDGNKELLSYVSGVWPNQRLTNAHCEALTLLLNQGILGSGCFAGIILYTLKKLWEENKRETKDVLTGACKLAVVAYAAHNLFSFQQVLNTPLMFILLGMAFPSCTREGSNLQENRRTIS